MLIMLLRINRQFQMKPVPILLFLLVVACALPVDAQRPSDFSLNEQLMIAADEGDSVKVQVLIRGGADVNAKTYEGVTPLMYAAQSGHLGIVQVLAEQGANINSNIFDGNTALMMAIQNNYFYVAEYLLSKGAHLDAADIDGITPLMYAIIVDSFYMADMVIAFGADVSDSDKSGKDALMLAAELGRFETAYSLLVEGANINSTNNAGNTPLHFSAVNGHHEVVELLLMNRAEPDAINKSGITPLALAVMGNDYETVKLLISYGADVNKLAGRNQNILSLVNRNTDSSIIDILKANGAVPLNKISFNEVTFGAGDRFNDNDQLVFFTFGLKSNIYNLMSGMSYGFRPKAIRVMEKESDNVYYQYWERRHEVSLYVDKGFFTTSYNSGLQTSAFLGLAGTFTFGSYRGTDENPEARFLISPRTGCMVDYGKIRLKLFYQYTDLQLKSYHSHWAGIGLEFLIQPKPIVAKIK